MTHIFKLERLDGTPADPPSFKTTVLAWNPGDTIPDLGGPDAAGRSRPRRRGELPVLVVHNLS
jgi:hypothetical protein